MNPSDENQPSAMVVAAGGYGPGRYSAWGSRAKVGGVEVGVIDARLIDVAETFAAPIFYQEGDQEGNYRRPSGVAVHLVVPGAGPISIYNDWDDADPILPDAMDDLVSTRSRWALIVRQDADVELVQSFLRDRLPASATLSLYKDYERSAGA